MIRSILVLSVPVLLAACQASDKPADGAAVKSSATAADTGADEQSIRGQVAGWIELAKAKDARTIAGLYTEDGALMPPNAPISKGRDDIEKTWAAMMQAPGFELDIIPERIVVSSSGDMAFDRGAYRLTVAPDGKKQTDTGKYVVVWRKVDGEWKAAADIINSDLPASGS
jgi:uncharacterized protein (TIGR02246 family)